MAEKNGALEREGARAFEHRVPAKRDGELPQRADVRKHADALPRESARDGALADLRRVPAEKRKRVRRRVEREFFSDFEMQRRRSRAELAHAAEHEKPRRSRALRREALSERARRIQHRRGRSVVAVDENLPAAGAFPRLSAKRRRPMRGERAADFFLGNAIRGGRGDERGVFREPARNVFQREAAESETVVELARRGLHGNGADAERAETFVAQKLRGENGFSVRRNRAAKRGFFLRDVFERAEAFEVRRENVRDDGDVRTNHRRENFHFAGNAHAGLDDGETVRGGIDFQQRQRNAEHVVEVLFRRERRALLGKHAREQILRRGFPDASRHAEDAHLPATLATVRGGDFAQRAGGVGNDELRKRRRGNEARDERARRAALPRRFEKVVPVAPFRLERDENFPRRNFSRVDGRAANPLGNAAAPRRAENFFEKNAVRKISHAENPNFAAAVFTAENARGGAGAVFYFLGGGFVA